MQYLVTVYETRRYAYLVDAKHDDEAREIGMSEYQEDGAQGDIVEAKVTEVEKK